MLLQITKRSLTQKYSPKSHSTFKTSRTQTQSITKQHPNIILKNRFTFKLHSIHRTTHTSLVHYYKTQWQSQRDYGCNTVQMGAGTAVILVAQVASVACATSYARQATAVAPRPAPRSLFRFYITISISYSFYFIAVYNWMQFSLYIRISFSALNCYSNIVLECPVHIR